MYRASWSLVLCRSARTGRSRMARCPVNVASRIGEYARPGEVLVSQAVVDACEGAPVSFRSIGPVEFKGTTDAIHLYAASRGD